MILSSANYGTIQAHMKTNLTLFILLFLIVSCLNKSTPDKYTPEPRMSSWGSVFIIAQSQQTHAPAIEINGNNIFAAWIAVDENGPHHYISNITTDRQQITDTLPLNPIYPHMITIAPAANYNTHIVWMDAETDRPGAELRLWSALLTPALQMERGPILVTDKRTGHYTAVSASNGDLWVIWSGGLLSEPSLFIQRVDGIGRRWYPDQLLYGADWPTAIYVGTTLYLFWIGVPDNVVYRAILRDGQLEQITPLTTSVRLNRGDRLATFDVGIDTSNAYLFWNIVRSDGQAQTWMTNGAFNATEWSEPTRLGVDTSKLPFDTGYNGGIGLQATAGQNWASWAAPMKSQSDKLLLAAQVDNVLGIIYLNDGQILSYQPVFELDEVGLIGVPSLSADIEHHLYLAWSKPTTNGYAELTLAMTR